MKSKNKGFTLVEIIGVVTVLALILLVSVPALTKTLKRNEQKKFDSYLDNIKVATENYIVKDSELMNDISEKEYTYISVKNLIDAGLIKELAINPTTKEKISKDTRVKITKNADETFNYEVQPYYNSTDDYNNDSLIIHYDSVNYNKKNIFKNLKDEIDYNYSNRGIWTEDGILFDKSKVNNISQSLNKTYSTDKLTVSFNFKSLEDLKEGGSDYTYPLYLINYNNNTNTDTAYFGSRKSVRLFYGSGHSTVFSKESLKTNKNYTITFVQEGLSVRNVYINGVLNLTGTNLPLVPIVYNKMMINPCLYNLKLNNMLVYNRALNAEEVNNLYQLDLKRFGE